MYSKTYKNIINFLVYFTVALLLLGCGQEKEKVSTSTVNKPIKIGVILPLTGDGAIYGLKEKNGIELAVTEKNKAGGINNRNIEVIYEDSQGTPATAVSALRKLITHDKVKIIIGGAFSSPTLAMVPIINEKEIILISPTASSPKLSGSSEFFFRVWPSDVAEGAVAAELSIRKLGLKKLAVLHGNNDYAIGLKDIFIKTVHENGGEIIAVEVYNEGDSDFRTQLSKIKRGNPDGIYLSGYAKEFSKILTQTKELSINKQLISCGTFHEPEILQLAGNAAEGVVFVQPYFDRDSKDQRTQDFINKYDSNFNSEAGVYSAHAYDAGSVILEAMSVSSNNTNIIKNELNRLKDFPGVTGTITFVKGGDVIKPMRIMTVNKNQFVEFIQ